MKTKKYYTTAELAKIQGISERGIRKQIEAGKYPNAKKKAIKYEWIIPASDVKKTTLAP